jgi:RNA polymerase sigma-70 factor (ECF subfamily)
MVPGQHMTKPDAAETSQWLHAFSRGDNDAFENIFRQYYQPLCRYAATLTLSNEEAEDIVQRVFVKIWEQRERLNIHSSLKSYLYKMVQHHFLNDLRRNKLRTMHEDAMKTEKNDQLSAGLEIESAELKKKIQAVFEKLPEQCRLIFRLSRVEELRYKEIAEVLGISIKTVENQMGKALKIMRAELADYLPILAALGLIQKFF